MLGETDCRPTVTMPGGELGTGHPGGPGAGLLPGLHFTNIYREPPCARRCAGHWGHRDERDTLSTHPCSFPLSQGPVPEPCTEGGRGGAPWTEPRGEKQGLGVWKSGHLGSCPPLTGHLTLGTIWPQFPHYSMKELGKMTPPVLTHSDR